MSRLRAWVIAAALGGAAVTAAPVRAADAPADTRPWYKKVFVSAPKPAGPAVRSGPVMPARPMSAPLPPDAVREAVKAEADALLRRMDVCDKLRQAAFDKNDEALMRQVDELERQAKAVYEARVAALGVSKSAKAPLPPTGPTHGVVTSLDFAPEKPLDPKAAAANLVAPAAPVPVSGTAALEPEAPVREVKP